MKKIFFVLSIVLAFVGCNDDDSDFLGKDNYITEFSLQKDGELWGGRITETNDIVLTVAAETSLEGATAKVTVSENATISPDPASVTDWTKAIVFTVTSYNGTSREYHYQLNREDLATEGSVRLATQADVDDFASSGVKIVRGSLFIGSTTAVASEDSITSLSGLTSLEEVTANIVINPTYKGGELVLDNLTKVSGDILIENISSIKAVRFPKLQTVNGTLSYLTETDLTKEKDTHLLSFPELQEVGLNFTMQIVNYRNDVIEENEISAPKLEKVGGVLSISSSIQMSKVNLTSLKETSGLYLQGQKEEIAAGTKQMIALNKLERVNGDFTIAAYAGLEEVHLPMLVAVAGNFTIDATNMRIINKIDATRLVTVGGDLILKEVAITDFSGFSSLKSVGGSLKYDALVTTFSTTLNGLEALTTVGNEVQFSGMALSDLSGIRNLQAAKRLYIWTYSPVLNTEALKNIDIDELVLQIQPTSEGTYDLKGVKAKKAILYGDINKPDCISVYQFDAEMQCNIEVYGYTRLEGLRKIDGELNAGKRGSFLYMYRGFDFPDLEEVTGDLYYAAEGKPLHKMPKLKQVGGNLTGYMSCPGLPAEDSTPFPSLENVGGFMELQINLADLKFPNLKKVGGALQIEKGVSWRENLISRLDGFSTLESAASITVRYCEYLYSFKGLEKAIASLTDASQWEATSNKYNPNFAAVKNGELEENNQ